jgi:hypothetical protein
MSRLTQFESSRNYTQFSDSNSSSLVLAMPFNKENGIRDVSHLIRGTGSEFANITYNRYNYGSIVNHETCHYDSSLRIPYTPYQNTVGIYTPGLTGATPLATQNWTIECWIKFDSFDFEAQFDILYPSFIDSTNAADDVPYFVITGDGWPTVSERRGLQLRRGTGVAQSTIITNANNLFSPGIWHHIAATRDGNTFRIALGTKQSQGSGVAVDGILAGENIGARGTIVASATNTHSFTGYNYVWFSRTFNKGRMPLGVYVQDFRFYIGAAKYITTYRVPEPMFLY